MKDINLISLDLEYSQPDEKIIQVGIAVGNLLTGEILRSHQWNIYQDTIITPFITKLCNITQEDIDNGFPLEFVYNSICDIHKEYNCFRNALVWGGGDSEDLRKALEMDNEMFVFGRRWIDAKTVFISYCFKNNLKTQAGLAKAMTKLGLNFIGRKHTAMDDAINTFRIYHKLLDMDWNYTDVW